MSLLTSNAFLLASFFQSVGGGSETIHQWDGNAGDWLGRSVSNAGDVNRDGIEDQIVGAPYTGMGSRFWAGSATVFSGVDGTILHQWYGGNNEKLGWSVSGAGDVNGDGYHDLIVGTYGASPGGKIGAGSAYVFSGANGSVLHKWNGWFDYQLYGFSVSGAGDVNGDGYSDLIVGASASEWNYAQIGSAYVYSGIDGTLLFSWKGGIEKDNFGISVSGAGDVNQDGLADLIVGAPMANPGGNHSAGSAFVFSGADASLLFQWDGMAESDRLGNSVSDAGDVNGDGVSDLIVGAYHASPGGRYNAGSVYVYSGLDGSRLFQWDGGDDVFYFGLSVSKAGDVDGDGFADVLVGSPYTDSGVLLEAGSVSLYSGADGFLVYQWEGGFQWGEFGFSVSDAGDITGDGFADVIVGAPRAEVAGNNSGSAYVFSFLPFLRANTSTVSASTGGMLDLDLTFPQAAGLHMYKVLISASGTGPTHFGIEVPLTLDFLVIDTFFGNYHGQVHNGLHGTLDSSGNASGSLNVAAGIPSTLIGHTFYLAAIANHPGQLPEISSVAVDITITP